MRSLSRFVAGVAFIALLGMVGVTLGDIVLRLLSRIPGAPFAGAIPLAVPGVVDLVQLMLVAVAHLSIAVTFMLGTHVTVDIVANLLPVKIRAVTRRAGWAIGVAFMSACFYEATGQAHSQFVDGVLSATINLPIWWYWLPVIAGTALAAVACLAHLVRRRPSGTGDV